MFLEQLVDPLNICHLGVRYFGSLLLCLPFGCELLFDDLLLHQPSFHRRFLSCGVTGSRL